MISTSARSNQHACSKSTKKSFLLKYCSSLHEIIRQAGPVLLNPHSKAVLSTKLLRRSLLNLECYCQFQSASVLSPKTPVFISILEKNALGHNKSLLLFHFRRGFSRRATMPRCSVCTSGKCRITFTSRGQPCTSVVNMQAHSENHTDITEYLTSANCDIMVKF